MSNGKLFDPEDTITLKDAIRITTNWRDYIAPLSPSGDYIRAFYIPIIDIQNLARLYPWAEAVRAYVALETPGDPSSAKLALVPVGPHGNDILETPEGDASSTAQADVSSTAHMESAIYDFTQPCPATCDIDSPLYTGV